MTIQLNGKAYSIEPNTSIRMVLDSKGINPNVVACELNLTIIKRAVLHETILKEGDQLEIIQMIGGG